MPVEAQTVEMANKRSRSTNSIEKPVQSIQHHHLLAQTVSDSRRREWSSQKSLVDGLNRHGDCPNSLEITQNQVLTVSQEGPLCSNTKKYQGIGRNQKTQRNAEPELQPDSRKTITRTNNFLQYQCQSRKKDWEKVFRLMRINRS